MAEEACSYLPKEMENAEVVVFDFDGTLFNLELDWDRLKEDLSQYVYENYNIERSFNPLVETVDELRLGHKVGENVFKGMLKVVNKYEMEAGHKPIQKSLDLLREIKASGKKVAVFTLNTKNVVESVIEEHGLSNLIDYKVCFEDVKWHKPETEGLDAIKDHFQLGKDRIIFIGDSERDRECGVNFGVKTYDIDFVLTSWDKDRVLQ